MKLISMGKAVRDHIPSIIQESGDTPIITVVADPKQYIALLTAKLNEERLEFVESESIAELIDILEVVYAIARLKGISYEVLEAERLVKLEAKGGFVQQIYLQAIQTK